MSLIQKKSDSNSANSLNTLRGLFGGAKPGAPPQPPSFTSIACHFSAGCLLPSPSLCPSPSSPAVQASSSTTTLSVVSCPVPQSLPSSSSLPSLGVGGGFLPSGLTLCPHHHPIFPQLPEDKVPVPQPDAQASVWSSPGPLAFHHPSLLPPQLQAAQAFLTDQTAACLGPLPLLCLLPGCLSSSTLPPLLLIPPLSCLVPISSIAIGLKDSMTSPPPGSPPLPHRLIPLGYSDVSLGPPAAPWAWSQPFPHWIN